MTLTVTATFKHTLKSRLLYYATALLVILGMANDEWINQQSERIVKRMKISIDGRPFKRTTLSNKGG